ncbi:MAG: hypothetical protein AB7J37_05200 [Candidatus Melainabacteria bacterium]
MKYDARMRMPVSAPAAHFGFAPAAAATRALKPVTENDTAAAALGDFIRGLTNMFFASKQIKPQATHPIRGLNIQA